MQSTAPDDPQPLGQERLSELPSPQDRGSLQPPLATIPVPAASHLGRSRGNCLLFSLFNLRSLAGSCLLAEMLQAWQLLRKPPLCCVSFLCLESSRYFLEVAPGCFQGKDTRPSLVGPALPWRGAGEGGPAGRGLCWGPPCPDRSVLRGLELYCAWWSPLLQAESLDPPRPPPVLRDQSSALFAGSMSAVFVLPLRRELP